MSLPPPGSEPDQPFAPPSSSTPNLPRPVGGGPTPTPGWPVAAPSSGATPPPGYVAYSANSGPAALRSTAGLRKTTIGLFWAAVVATFAQAGAFFSRVSVWDDFIVGSAGLRELDDADGLVVLTGLARVGLTISAAIVLAVWSYRAVCNAQQFGMSGLQPKLAAWGWFIPFGNLWVPFSRLRTTTEAFGAEGKRVKHWQIAWVVFFILSWYANTNFNFSTFEDRSSIRTALSDEASFSVVVALAMACSAFLAQRALNHIDQTILDRRETDQRAAMGPTA